MSDNQTFAGERNKFKQVQQLKQKLKEQETLNWCYL